MSAHRLRRLGLTFNQIATELGLNGTPGQRKALLKELVVEVRVESRDSILPTFRLPTTSVRVSESMVGRDGLEPHTSAVRGPERCA